MTAPSVPGQATWAADAEHAPAPLAGAEAAFDVVFSDVVVPGMDGVGLGREVRRHHPVLPVVPTSGHSHVPAQESRHGFELLHEPHAVEEPSRLLRKVTRPAADAG